MQKYMKALNNKNNILFKLSKNNSTRKEVNKINKIKKASYDSLIRYDSSVSSYSGSINSSVSSLSY